MKTIATCRMCGNNHLAPILDLGAQPISAVFPLPDEPDPRLSPLTLVKCDEDTRPGACGLVQLRHSAAADEMYGQTYGYRSSTSPTMRAHLEAKVRRLLDDIEPAPGDAVLDIGCNDGTLLHAYGERGLFRAGIDPSSEKFIDDFDPGIEVAFDFFSADRANTLLRGKRCRIITSIAMFYDLEDPLSFMRGIKAILASDGVWQFELSYLPLMMTNLTYDQICHEHLLYLGLRQIEWLADRAGLAVLDLDFNEMNGGSVDIRVAHAGGPYRPNRTKLDAVRHAEEPLKTPAPFMRFHNRVLAHRESVRSFFDLARAAGKTVYGYGASTKGNIILNACDLTIADMPAICDKQPPKHGRITPGARIPIISQQKARQDRPDYFFVFIWHLRREVILDERDYLQAGGKLVFHLPRLHVVDNHNWQRYLDAPFEDFSFSL